MTRRRAEPDVAPPDPADATPVAPTPAPDPAAERLAPPLPTVHFITEGSQRALCGESASGTVGSPHWPVVDCRACLRLAHGPLTVLP